MLAFFWLPRGITCVPCDVILLGDQANSSQSRAHVSEEVLARAVGAGSRAGPTPISPHVLQSCRQVRNLCTQAHTLVQTNTRSPSLCSVVTHSSMRHNTEVQNVCKGYNWLPGMDQQPRCDQGACQHSSFGCCLWRTVAQDAQCTWTPGIGSEMPSTSPYSLSRACLPHLVSTSKLFRSSPAPRALQLTSQTWLHIPGHLFNATSATVMTLFRIGE